MDKEIHFLDQSSSALLVNSVEDLKHKCLILLMLDAGLRVSEVISLKFGAFDFKKQTLSVRSLKKRKASKDFQNRQIPLSQRLFLCLAEYAKTFDKLDRDTFLFQSPLYPDQHIKRQAVNKFLKRLSINKLNIPHLHPHALRHSFASNLAASDTSINEIADLLGHQDYNTSRIYTHIPQAQLAKCINAASAKGGAKPKFFLKFFKWFFSKSPVIPYIPNQNVIPIVGRSSELMSISDHLANGTNVIIFGQHGTGKRLLLDSVKTDKKILTFDDTASIKKSLIYMLLYLYENDKEQVANVLFGDFDKQKDEQKGFDKTKEETRLSRQSVGYLCDQIKKIVVPKEYVLKIRQFDDINRQSLKVIDNLKNTFVILTTATEISITKAPFFWDFEKIEVKNLNRSQSFDLIHRLSYDLKVGDYEVYKSHIYQQTDGNPKAISQMIERYRREPKLLAENIRSVIFSGAVKEWDVSIAVVLLIAGLAVMRFMTGELDNPALRFLGGAAMVLLILTRTVVSKTKRKFI